MTKPKTKLEPTWIDKKNRPELEPRVLLEDLPAPKLLQAGMDKSCHAQDIVTDHVLFDNPLLFGDNLLALKDLGMSRARVARM